MIAVDPVLARLFVRRAEDRLLDRLDWRGFGWRCSYSLCAL
jgi:hypothetical protein